MRHHAVQLYQEEEELAASLAQYVGAGLALGQGVVFLGGPARWQATMERLRGAGVDTHNAVLRGQLRLFGARVVLSSCMSHALPERRAFNESIAGIFALMRMRYPVLRVFGGLTDELWTSGRRQAAGLIERFWNTLEDAQSVSVLCACPLDSLDGRDYEGALQTVCSQHTHLLTAGDSRLFDEAVSSAVREVLEPQLHGMLHALSTQDRPATQMPQGQATMFWLRQHMPRTAERVLARVRARL